MTVVDSTFDAFSCIELVDPDHGDIADVAGDFGLHPLAIEDAIKAHQRPKLERYGDTQVLVVKSAHYDDATEAVAFGEILLMYSDAFLVIVRHSPAPALDLVTGRGPAVDDDVTPLVVVHRIVDQVVDGYAPVLAGFELDVAQTEETVFTSVDHSPTERIYRLKRQLLSLLHALRPLLDPLHRLIDTSATRPGPDLAEYFRDVEDHVQRFATRASRASELVSDMLDANLAQVSVRQNEDMRKMSAWAAIFLLPTVLAGIWGMNFDTMPELDWFYGYPAALGIMIAGSGLLYWRFRRSGWL